jgi:hypothetical protein
MTESTTDRLHAAIMNLRASPRESIDNWTPRSAFVQGHKDARHAAADLVAAADPQTAPMLWLAQVREDFRRMADEADRMLTQHADRMLGGCDEGAESGAIVTNAARDVLAERARQISVEGWTPQHDDQHAGGSMAFAAAAYAVHANAGQRVSSPLWNWTGWSRDWWKPKDARSDLIRAAALLLAEIERLDRASHPSRLSAEQAQESGGSHA